MHWSSRNVLGNQFNYLQLIDSKSKNLVSTKQRLAGCCSASPMILRSRAGRLSLCGLDGKQHYNRQMTHHNIVVSLHMDSDTQRSQRTCLATMAACDGRSVTMPAPCGNRHRRLGGAVMYIIATAIDRHAGPCAHGMVGPFMILPCSRRTIPLVPWYRALVPLKHSSCSSNRNFEKALGLVSKQF